MANIKRARGWFLALIILGLLLSCGFTLPNPLAPPTAPAALTEQAFKNPPQAKEKANEGTSPANSSTDVQAQWARAVEAATRAANLAQTAQTAQDWDAVTVAWAQAISEMQAIPTGSPQRTFAQRKVREYVQSLAIAQQQAERRSAPKVFPTLGSPVLDEQIGLYLSYIATVGTPDVLIIGSSRALQGVDPQALQAGLATQGYPGLKVFNFGINGATAQVMSFVLRQVLQPEQLPRLVIWADGSRAFNSGRYDRTFAGILSSPGYQTVRAGTQPLLQRAETPSPPNAVSLPISSITAQGFLPVADRFDPALYYRSFPRVSGRYDDVYNPFQLEGVQSLSLEAVATLLRSRNIPLILVNLPLSDDYLDSVRLGYERQFQTYLRQQANRNGFTLIDLLEQWRNRDPLFADPSHLNQFGAFELGRQLAANKQIPWASLQPPKESNPPEAPQENPQQG
ncbi:MAG TPA: hypothetical protein V6D29_21355 [Leptolyngbyaceae cyanobacterium]